MFLLHISFSHNSKKNFLNSLLNKTADAVNKSPEQASNKNHIRPEIQHGSSNANQPGTSEHNSTDSNNEEEPKSIVKSIHSGNYSETNSSSMRSPSKSRDNGNYQQQQQQSMSPSKKNGHMSKCLTTIFTDMISQRRVFTY